MPQHLLVIENPSSWDLDIPGVRIVSARDYLVDRELATLRRAVVFNLCRTYSYHTIGYYVSLLAAARSHRPLPSVGTLQDLRSAPILRVVSEGLQHEVQRALAALKAERFTLSIYFGRNLAKRYDRLCQALFSHFPAPFLRGEFVHTDRWRLNALRPIASDDIPGPHREFVVEQARRYFARRPGKRKQLYRYDLAILHNPDEVDSPSDERAIGRFARAAEKVGMRTTFITRDDYGRIAEYDALFIRETTGVNHHTYRFARRAEAEGMVVIDDPTSIIRCTNKVYLAELFDQNGIPCPRTRVVHRDNARALVAELGMPVVLKRPDSSFGLGVVKAEDDAALERHLAAFFDHSELVVAQEYTPSQFDWRIGVLDGRALYACRYFMARGHWQIQKATGERSRSYGKTEAVAVADAPSTAVSVAERTAALIGDGLYGVDIKQIGDKFLVVEINDNPSIDAGCEDAVLKDGLYHAIMQSIYDRLERRGRGERYR